MKLIHTILVATLMSGWMAVTTSHAAEPNVYVVAIGNNAGAADEVELLYAERDARQVASVFQNLGQVRGTHTLILAGESADSVRRALLEVNARIRAHETGASRLIIYYSGHADATSLHLGGTRFGLDELKSIVDGSPAQVRLLILDACRSGAMTRVKGVRRAPEFKLRLRLGENVEGTAILTSSAAGENSQESDRLRGSFFTHHFLSALRGAADEDDDGRVTLTEAYKYSYRETLKSSGRSLDLQHPTFEYGIRGKGTVTLTWPLTARRSTGHLKIKRPGRYLIAEGRDGGPITMDVYVGKDGSTIALPQRTYAVQRREARRYLQYLVPVKARRATLLADYDYTTVAYDRLLRKGGGTARVVHGFALLAGAQGETARELGWLPVTALAYNADFESLSLSLRGRYGFRELTSNTTPLRTRRAEYGVRVLAQRYFDTTFMSLSLGLFGDLSRIGQSYIGDAQAAERISYVGGFGGCIGADIRIAESVSIRLEGGPLAQVINQADTPNGTVEYTGYSTPVTWWSQAGIQVRL